MVCSIDCCWRCMACELSTSCFSVFAWNTRTLETKQPLKTSYPKNSSQGSSQPYQNHHNHPPNMIRCGGCQQTFHGAGELHHRDHCEQSIGGLVLEQQQTRPCCLWHGRDNIFTGRVVPEVSTRLAGQVRGLDPTLLLRVEERLVRCCYISTIFPMYVSRWA